MKKILMCICLVAFLGSVGCDSKPAAPKADEGKAGAPDMKAKADRSPPALPK